MSEQQIPKSVFLFIPLLAIYWMGFYGGFIFDDFLNLTQLGVFNEGFSFEALKAYVLNSDSGPLKRPFSVLSFLIHDRQWPTSPFYFKLFNALFHLLNSILLFVVTQKLLKISTQLSSQKITTVAFFTAALWAFNPFFVSTVLYAVQRMAILPVTFCLFGIYWYLTGREHYAHDKYRKGLFFMALGVLGATSLAVLSKENTVILPLLLLLIELLLIQKVLKPLKPLHITVLLYVPCTVIVLALLVYIPWAVDGYVYREFSVFERLLTQPRALISYLGHLFIPTSMTAGIFNDGFVVSTGLFEPISTVMAIILVVGLLVAAVALRNRWPLLSFAVGFYFIGNLIESSFIPLEMYFEHRAYLPGLFAFLPLVYGVLKISDFNRFSLIMLSVYVLIMAGFTFNKAKLWGDNLAMHVNTAAQYPESLRASTIAASLLEQAGQPELAESMLVSATAHHDDIQLSANLLNIKCTKKTLTTQANEQFKQKLGAIKISKDDGTPLFNLLKSMVNKDCVIGQNSKSATLDLLKAIETNAGYEIADIRLNALYTQSWIYLLMGDDQQSLRYLTSVFEADLNTALMMVSHALSVSKKRNNQFMLKAIIKLLSKAENDLIMNQKHNIKQKIEWAQEQLKD